MATCTRIWPRVPGYGHVYPGMARVPLVWHGFRVYRARYCIWVYPPCTPLFVHHARHRPRHACAWPVCVRCTVARECTMPFYSFRSVPSAQLSITGLRPYPCTTLPSSQSSARPNSVAMLLGLPYSSVKAMLGLRPCHL